MSIWLWNIFLGSVDAVILTEIILLLRETKKLKNKLDEFNHVRVVVDKTGNKIKKNKKG